jgi:hypothetical protein
MKTTLRLISLGLACCLAASLAAEAGGASIPGAIDAWHLFLAFVATMSLQTLAFDYAPVPALRAASIARTPAPLIARRRPAAEAPHALAA